MQSTLVTKCSSFAFINEVRKERVIGVRTSIDVARYLIAAAGHSADDSVRWKSLNDAIVDYVLPQFDRLDSKTLEHVLRAANDNLTLRINAGKVNSKYFPLLNFIRLWKAFEWMLSEKTSLYDVLTRTLGSIGPDILYELWVFYKTLDVLGPMKQNFKNRSLFSNGKGIEAGNRLAIGES